MEDAGGALIDVGEGVECLGQRLAQRRADPRQGVPRIAEGRLHPPVVREQLRSVGLREGLLDVGDRLVLGRLEVHEARVVLELVERAAPRDRGGNIVQLAQPGVVEEVLVVDRLLEHGLEAEPLRLDVRPHLGESSLVGHPVADGLADFVDAGDQILGEHLDGLVGPGYCPRRLGDLPDPVLEAVLLREHVDHDLLHGRRVRGGEEAWRRPYERFAVLRYLVAGDERRDLLVRDRALAALHDAHEQQGEENRADREQHAAAQPDGDLASDPEAAARGLAGALPGPAGKPLQDPLEGAVDAIGASVPGAGHGRLAPIGRAGSRGRTRRRESR